MSCFILFSIQQNNIIRHPYPSLPQGPSLPSSSLDEASAQRAIFRGAAAATTGRSCHPAGLLQYLKVHPRISKNSPKPIKSTWRSSCVFGRDKQTATLNGRSHTNNLPGHLCPMELRPPRAKKSHTQSSSAWNAVQNRKMFQLQKNREVQTQWNTSHTHLERGTNFIIIYVRLHHRTAWNAAFTTWKKAAQNLHFFPDRHVQWNAGYKAPCAKDPSITPAVAPAGAAPSSSTKHQTSSSTKHSDVQVQPKTVLGTRPERGSERGANEVRTRSEGDPQSFTNFTA